MIRVDDRRIDLQKVFLYLKIDRSLINKSLGTSDDVSGILLDDVTIE